MSIEQKIAELLEDSIRLKNLNLQEADQEADQDEEQDDDQDDDEVVVIKKIIKKDKDADQDEDELDEDLSADQYNKKIGAKSTSKKAKAETKLPEPEDVLSADEYNKKIRDKMDDVGDYNDKFDKGVSEDVDALLFGEDLSEEFREKASTIFEAAVMNRVNSEVASLVEEFQDKLDLEVQEIQEELEDKIDSYLGYLAEQWLQENKLSIEKGLQNDILENFIGGMKNLFKEHYIDVPEEKFNIVEDLQIQIDHLESKLDESLEYNVEIRTKMAEMIRESLIADFCEGMTYTEIEKFQDLAEELNYTSEAAFVKKLEIIKENYFSKTPGRKVNSVVSDSPVQLTEDFNHTDNIDPNVGRYLDTFNRIKL